MNVSPRFPATVKAIAFLAGILAAAPSLHAQQIEAEAWTTMLGLQTETTTDVGGGLNVGWIDANDWAEYTNKTFAAGNWKVDVRMATMATNRQVQIYVDDVLKTTLTYAGNTAGWQTWATVTSAQFNIATGGAHKVKLAFPGNNMNLNWVKFVPQVSDATPPSVPATLAAPVKTNTGINFTWAAATDAESGIAGYDVVIDGGAAIALGNVTAYSAYGFAANSTHTLKVQARNGVGLVSGYQAAAFSATTTNLTNLLTNGDFANGNANWTLYQGTNLNVAGEYAVSTPVTANVYDVNVLNKLAMTQGLTYTLTFRARSNLNRTIVGGWGLAQAPWTNQSQTYALTAAWQNYSVVLASTVPSDASSRVFFDVAGAIAGEVHIDDVVLSTGAAPQPTTPPTSFTASAITNTGLTLNWSGAGPVGVVAGYQITWTPGAGSLNVGNVATSPVTGLTQNTQYTFLIKAKDGAGTLSATSTQLIVSTTNLDVTAPTVPAALATTAQTGNSISLSWQASTDAGGSGLQGYILTQTGAASATYTGITGTTFTVTPLTEASAYGFQIQAKDNAGNLSALSTPVLNVSTKDVTAPGVPANFASTGKTDKTITLGWTPSADNVGTTNYDIFMDANAAVAYGAVATATFSNLTAGSTHTFQIRARDLAGNASAYTTPAISVTTLAPDVDPPTAPQNVVSSTPELTAITLAWQASSDGAGSGIGEYQVKQIAPGTATYSAGLATTLRVTPLASTTSYTFQVLAKDVAGNFSVPSANIVVSTLDGTAPSVPGGLTASAKTDVSITLAWNASTDVGGGVASYEIQQTAPTAQTYPVPSGTSLQINSLAVGTSYTFQVRAKDFAGNFSAYTAALTVVTNDNTPPSAPANLASPTKDNTSINLTWSAATDVGTGVAGYEVQRTLPAPAFTYPLGTATTLNATGLAAGTAYTFQVRAKDNAGNFGAYGTALTVSTTNASANLLTNGDFSNGFTDWTVYQGASLNVPGEYAVTTAAGGNVYDVNVWHGVAMTVGNTYTLTFKARSNVTRTIVCGWGFAHDPWTNQNQVVTLTPTWKDYIFTGVSNVPTDPLSRVFFDVGGFAGEVHIDNVVLSVGTVVDNTPPDAPAAPTSPSQGPTSINLAWVTPFDNVGVTGYEIDTNGVFHSMVGAVNAAPVAGLKPGVTYAIRIRAKDNVGNMSANSPAINVTTTNGQGPLVIEAEAWTTMNGVQTEATTDVGGGLNVGWIDANDWAEYANQPLTAGSYKVEARMATMDVNRMVDIWVDGQLKTTVTMAAATGGWQTWATAISPAFTVAADGNHLIRAQFPNNNQNLNWIRFVPQAPDLTPPSIPGGLASTAQGGTTLSMSWTASTDAGSGVAGYRLFANGVLNATTGPVLAGTLTGLTVSTQYQVTIKAFDNAGNESGASAAIAVSTTDGSNLNGLYVLRDKNSGKCLEIAGGSVTDGAAAIQNNCDGSAQQKWDLIQVAGTTYKLKNLASAKVLDVKGGGTTNDVQQWADVNGAAQQWRILPVNGLAGHYTLNATSDLTECLDVLGANQTAGAAMQMTACAGAVSQQFAFIATEAVTACVAGAAPGNAVVAQQFWGNGIFTQPMELVQEPATVAGDHWVVMDQTGMIRRMNNNSADNTFTTFLDMRGKLTTTGESGLASLAFDPDYANNRFVYITYLSSAPQQTRVARYKANPDFKTVDPNSGFVLFRFDQPSDIHHSGSLVFGPGPTVGTKYLYVTIGDNGTNGQGDPTPVKVTQMNWPNGKVLRFTPTEYQGATEQLWDFNSTTANLHWIVATGLRNPWRTSFDGDDMWISNVGFDMNEEINKFNVKTDGVPNFGWPWCEGTICCSGSVNCALPGMPAKPADNLLKWPEHEYPRAEGNTNQGAVIAGFVYRGAAMPGLVGKFVFADFVDKTLFALDPVSKVRTVLLPTVGDIADIGQDRDGEIMLTDYGASKIWKVIPGAAQPLTWPPQNLSDAGCFTSLSENDVVAPTKAGVNPFGVAQKFWSDGADKQRYISVPPGATVDVNDPNDWKLPPGGVTIKTFRWPATGKNFETRFFVRHTNGVYAGYTYKWISATAATLVAAAGDTKDLGGGTTWNYPSRAQCMTCHNDKVNGSIALETRQINVSNQLNNMSNAGILNPSNPAPITPFPYHLDPAVPLSERATSYLHVNCATCHRGPTESSAGRATWDARYTTPLALKKACNELPFEAVSGDIANERIIKPGNSNLSTVWLRAHVRTGAYYMPPVASKVVDVEGVQMLSDWMNQLTNCQ